jgi:poly(3-hydroxybutyrate) depolymerase
MRMSVTVRRRVRRLAAAALIVASTLAGLAIAGRAGAAPGTITLPTGRTYILHAATQSIPSARPLVVALHGANQSGVTMQRMSALDAYADAHRLVVAYGEGINGRWDAGTCCASTPQDDVGYLRTVVADVAQRVLINPTRVYVVGFSNGGMMAWRAACEAPDLFVGAGVIAGALLVPCGPTPVHVYHVHGTADTTVPLAGGRGFESRIFPDSRHELARVAVGSVIRTDWWSGGHSWPTWATSAVVSWLIFPRLIGIPSSPIQPRARVTAPTTH